MVSDQVIKRLIQEGIYVKNRSHNLDYQHGIHLTIYGEENEAELRRVQFGPGGDLYLWTKPLDGGNDKEKGMTRKESPVLKLDVESPRVIDLGPVSVKLVNEDKPAQYFKGYSVLNNGRREAEFIVDLLNAMIIEGSGFENVTIDVDGVSINTGLDLIAIMNSYTPGISVINIQLPNYTSPIGIAQNGLLYNGQRLPWEEKDAFIDSIFPRSKYRFVRYAASKLLDEGYSISFDCDSMTTSATKIRGESHDKVDIISFHQELTNFLYDVRGKLGNLVIRVVNYDDYGEKGKEICILDQIDSFEKYFEDNLNPIALDALMGNIENVYKANGTIPDDYQLCREFPYGCPTLVFTENNSKIDIDNLHEELRHLKKALNEKIFWEHGLSVSSRIQVVYQKEGLDTPLGGGIRPKGSLRIAAIAALATMLVTRL